MELPATNYFAWARLSLPENAEMLTPHSGLRPCSGTSHSTDTLGERHLDALEADACCSEGEISRFPSHSFTASPLSTSESCLAYVVWGSYPFWLEFEF